jgi:hypothetical protein
VQRYNKKCTYARKRAFFLKKDRFIYRQCYFTAHREFTHRWVVECIACNYNHFGNELEVIKPLGDHYLRPIPGRTGYAAYCRKPEYPKKKQKEMAEREMVKKLSAVSKKASVILRDPVQRAEWEDKHRAALREASKHQRMPDAQGKPAVPARLCDYVRRELSKQTK